VSAENHWDFFEHGRELERQQDRQKKLGEEAKKVCEDTFSDPTGKRCLEILDTVLGGRVGTLECPFDPIAIAQRDTMRRVYWFIEGMARKVERREIV